MDIKRLVFLVAFGALAGWASAGEAPFPVFPLEEIRPGLRGVVKTVFQGSEVEDVQVEIRGVLEGAIAPGRSLIIGRLIDEKTEVSGAVHGMSGSPLYINGKLAGALSRRLMLFEKDGHCGFTPVEDMVDVARRGEPEHPSAGSWNPHPFQTGFQQMVAAGAAGIQRLSIPLSLTGGSQQWQLMHQQVREWFPGLLPVAGGARRSAQSSVRSELPLPEAGSALSVVLMDGTMTLAATGTTTWVDGDQVVGFGHPMFGLGPTDFPIAPAEIVSVVPSYLMPHKLSNAGSMAGTLTQDRLSAVSGQLGPLPSLASYRVERAHQHQDRQTWEGRLIKHPLLVPQLVTILMINAMMDEQDSSRLFTLNVRSTIIFDGLPTYQRESIYSGGWMDRLTAVMNETAPLSRLYGRFREELELLEVRIEVDSFEQGQVWEILSLTVPQTTVSVSESLPVRIHLQNDNGEEQIQMIDWTPPEELSGKSVQLEAVSGRDRNREDLFSRKPTRTLNPADSIALLNQSYGNDRIYLRAVLPATGFQAGRSLQSGLPYGVNQVTGDFEGATSRQFMEPVTGGETSIRVEGTVAGRDAVRLTLEPAR